MEKIENEARLEMLKRIDERFKDSYDTNFDGTNLTFKYYGKIFLDFDVKKFCMNNKFLNQLDPFHIPTISLMVDKMIEIIDANFRDVVGLTNEEFRGFIVFNYLNEENKRTKPSIVDLLLAFRMGEI